MGQRYESDVSTILATVKAYHISQRTLSENTMLHAEIGVREFDDPGLIAKMARCCSDADLVP